jgi:hypothetical protein
MSWLSNLIRGNSVLRELGELAYFIAQERYISSILSAYEQDPELSPLTPEQRRAAASIALEVVRRKLLGR